MIWFLQEINGIHQILLDFSWNDIDSLTFQVVFIFLKLVKVFDHRFKGTLGFFFLTVDLQGSKFEIVSSASLCIPKLVYHSPSAFHSKHILMHIRDSHRLHFSTREAAIYVQHLEDMEGWSLLCLHLFQHFLEFKLWLVLRCVDLSFVVFSCVSPQPAAVTESPTSVTRRPWSRDFRTSCPPCLTVALQRRMKALLPVRFKPMLAKHKEELVCLTWIRVLANRRTGLSEWDVTHRKLFTSYSVAIFFLQWRRRHASVRWHH